MYCHDSGTIYCKEDPHSESQVHLFKTFLGDLGILDHCLLLFLCKRVLPPTLFELVTHVLKMLVGDCPRWTTALGVLLPPLLMDHRLGGHVAPPAAISFHHQFHLHKTKFMMHHDDVHTHNVSVSNCVWWCGYSRLQRCSLCNVSRYKVHMCQHPYHLTLCDCHFQPGFIIAKVLATERPVPHALCSILAPLFLRYVIVTWRMYNVYHHGNCNSMYIPCVQCSCIYGWVQVCGWHCMHGTIIITCIWQGCVYTNCMMYIYSFQRVTQHMDPHTLTGSLWTLPSLGPSSFCLSNPSWWASWWT